MRNFFNSIVMTFKRYMYGRYGIDELSRATLITAFVLLVISFVPYLGFAYYITVLLIVWAYIRGFSRNIAARQAELTVYYKFKRKIKSKKSLRQKMWRERKDFRYFKCEYCKSYWRIPRGKGKVEITCRSCGAKMFKKT